MEAHRGCSTRRIYGGGDEVGGSELKGSHVHARRTPPHRLRLADGVRHRSRRLRRRSSANRSRNMASRSSPITASPPTSSTAPRRKRRPSSRCPRTVKRGYHDPGRRRRARLYAVRDRDRQGRSKAYDLKEFWHVGRELPPGHAYPRTDGADNVWPEEVASLPRHLPRAVRRVRQGGAAASSRRSPAISASIRTISSRYRSRTAIRCFACSITRRSRASPAANVRAGAHEDINTITLLLGAEEAGLELLDQATANGCRSSPKPGELVVNIGDMLQRLTNDVLRSTSHRVVNPPPERWGHSRYSMPFFLHFRRIS